VSPEELRSAVPAVPPAGIDAEGAAPAPLSALPFPLRLLQRFPVLQGVPARAIAIGPLPEHAPEWARRAPSRTPG
jgi:hypothetical protein